mmetsp:Transcript_34738/g.137009  ORF Transcript_34738/g.137009 Transcript_34738/m.137009 type:complete len:231 (-) Transcript_34738:2069-2761(-)
MTRSPAQSTFEYTLEVEMRPHLDRANEFRSCLTDVCRTRAVRTSCSLLTVELAAMLFEKEDEVDLIGDLEGRVWAQDQRGRRKLEILGLEEPVRQIVVGRGVAVIGSLGTAKLAGSNGIVLCGVPQPSSLSCALEPPSGGFAVSIVSNRYLFIVSDEGKVGKVNTRRGVDSVLQTSEDAYMLYSSGHLEKIECRKFFAPISHPSNTKGKEEGGLVEQCRKGIFFSEKTPI